MTAPLRPTSTGRPAMPTRRTAILTALALGAATMSTSDDLTDLFTPQPTGPSQPMTYMQGVIQKWNPVTLENTVLVGRTVLPDVPVLGAAEVASFKPGVVVGLAIVGSTWAIIGRFVVPGTADATDAITQIGQRALTAQVLTLQATASGTFTDLATPGPAVNNVRIPASGKAFVTVSAQFDNAGTTGTGTLCVGSVGVAVSGDATIAADSKQSLILIAPSAGINASRTLLFSGLPAGGVCNFSLKYSSNGTETMQFSNRDITVELK